MTTGQIVFSGFAVAAYVAWAYFDDRRTAQKRKRALATQAQPSTQPRKPLPAAGSVGASVCQLELQVSFLLREVLWLRRQVEAHGAELETPRPEAAGSQLEVAQ